MNFSQMAHLCMLYSMSKLRHDVTSGNAVGGNKLYKTKNKLTSMNFPQ